MVIPWWQIQRIDLPDNIELAGGQIISNPNSTRYLFAPSAITLPKGSGYFQNVMVGLNSVNYGISDHVTITGGLELFSTFASMFLGEAIAIGFINVKTGFQVHEKLYIGGGLLAGGAVFQDGGRGALGYGLITYGSPNSNITIGAGLGNVFGEWKDDPAITINGMHMVNRKIGLVTENWINLSREKSPLTDEGTYDDNYNYVPGSVIGTSFYSNTTFVFSGGLRIISGKVTFDIALVSSGERYLRDHMYDKAPSSGIVRRDYKNTNWIPFPLPFLGLVYKF